VRRLGSGTSRVGGRNAAAISRNGGTLAGLGTSWVGSTSRGSRARSRVSRVAASGDGSWLRSSGSRLRLVRDGHCVSLGVVALSNGNNLGCVLAGRRDRGVSGNVDADSHGLSDGDGSRAVLLACGLRVSRRRGDTVCDSLSGGLRRSRGRSRGLVVVLGSLRGRGILRNTKGIRRCLG
jgi:hypothetical protein